MEQLDNIQIHFTPDKLFVLNICLAFLMFGVALDIKVSDFKALLQNPKAPFTGLVSQLLLLPILTLALVYAFAPPLSMALGMVLVSVCPGGNVSNFAVHLAKGNTALSVSLTSIVTLAAIFLTPIGFAFWSGFVPEIADFDQKIYVNPSQMVNTIVLLIMLPLCCGMGLNYWWPIFTAKIRKPVRMISIFLFLSFIVVALYLNFENVKDYLSLIFMVVLVHNGLALSTGYTFAKLMGLNQKDVKAIAIETGIQNSGLGLIIIFNFFDGLGGMALVAAWWGIWHLVSGFILAMLWGRHQHTD